ncbi:MAG: hypothetical protein WDN25_27570 [Acetobacteraceae bacterium]
MAVASVGRNSWSWGPKQLASLPGVSIKEARLDRHERIEKRPPEPQKNQESREIPQSST